MEKGWNIDDFLARVKEANDVVKFSSTDMMNLIRYCYRIFSSSKFQGGLPEKVLSDFLSSDEYKNK
jgi:hypothetical protein